MRNYELIGHRGYPEKYPENTLIGFQAALDLGADGVELDVHLSKDCVPIVFHDESFDRTADLAGSIRDTDAAEIIELSVHEPGRFADKFYPTFPSTLRSTSLVLNAYDASVFIELKRKVLKTFSREVFLEAVLLASEMLGNKRRLISFDWEILYLARTQCSVPLGWVIEQYDEDTYHKAMTLAPDYLVCNYEVLPTDCCLWGGNWKWFLYDVVDSDTASFWADRGVACIESWDIENLIEGEYASKPMLKRL